MSTGELLRQALYADSFKRLKKRGLSEEAADRIAREVVTQTIKRTKSPDIDSEDQWAGIVHAVCGALSEGHSYYQLICERPYLVTGRIDRLVAAAGRVRPEVPEEVATGARRATGLERLSGSLAVLFTATALAGAGIWYALAVGLFVSVGSELYMQTGMPAIARRTAARYRMTSWLGTIALLALLFSAYSWLEGTQYPLFKGMGLALFAFLVVAVAPGLTLAFLVGMRERRWRSDLEKELVRKETDGS